MNVEERYRTTLDELTRDRAGGPDLAAVIAGGRRRRRVRRTAWAGAGVAVAAVATMAGLGLTRDGGTVDPAPAVDPGPSSASYHDFVAGTDLDESFQAVVGSHLPVLGDALEVSPSDWNHDGPITDVADATDWQLRYSVGDDELTVVLGKRIPGSGTLGCRDSAGPDASAGQPACSLEQVSSGGEIVTDSYYTVSDGRALYVFITTYVRADGSQVSAQQRLSAASWPDAVDDVAFTPGELRGLVTDPALTFPDPVRTPAPPPTD